jgi:hypothetical protein
MNTATNAKPIALSENQSAILMRAIAHPQGKLDWFPDTIKGGARQKVIESLFKRGLVIGHGGDWIVTAEAYDALGRPRPDAPTTGKATTPAEENAAKPARKNARKAATPKPDAAATGDAPRTRENSKQAQVIAMLRRPEGATIQQICDATQWQAHTVRGTFAGAFKKKLKLTITSDKAEGGVRVYRISEAEATA